MTKQTQTFKKTDKQQEAIRAMCNYPEIMLEGGSRSGKTFIIIYALIVRAIKHERSKHIALRKHFNHAKLSLWHKTIPDVIKICFPGLKYVENKSDFFIEFENGSQLWIGGTDDKERIEKILGTEWASIFMSEASQYQYYIYETMKTRLNPPKGVKPLLVMDQNPPSKTHWTYKLFHDKVNPETKQKLDNPERYCYIKINPKDNEENLSDGYIETLESMSEQKKRRFLYGEYSDDSENALWKRDWIIQNRINTLPDKMSRVIVAVDPAVTGTDQSDDTGIIVCGKYKVNAEDHYCIISDKSYHGGVTGWGRAVADAYAEFSADKVIGEVNQGGDLVEMNIRNYNKSIPYEAVRATRGKAVRAEPIADMYRRGLVHHYGEFPELEDQLCEWTPESVDSPDRLDAAVWGLSYLSGTYSIHENKITGWSGAVYA